MMKTYVHVIVAMLAAAIVVLLGLASVSVVRIMSKSMTKAQAYGTMLTADRFDLQQPLVDVDDRHRVERVCPLLACAMERRRGGVARQAESDLLHRGQRPWDGMAEPRNLHVSSTGGGAVSIAWDPVEGAKRCGVYTIRADEAYDSWQQSKAFETEQTSVQLNGLDALRSAEEVGVTAVDGEGNESYIHATALRFLAGEPQDEPYTMSTWREIEDRKAEEAARAKNLAQPVLVRPTLTSWRPRIHTRGPVEC